MVLAARATAAAQKSKVMLDKPAQAAVTPIEKRRKNFAAAFSLWTVGKTALFFGWWKLFVSLSTTQRKRTALFLYGFYRRRLLHCFKHWVLVSKASSQFVLAGNNAAVFWDEKFLSQSLKLLSLNKHTLLGQTDAESRSRLHWEKRHFH